MYRYDHKDFRITSFESLVVHVVREISFRKGKKKKNLPASNDFFEIGKFCDIGSQRWDKC